MLYPCDNVQLRPVVFQEAPPSVDFRTPLLYVSSPSASPVATYMTLEFVGSNAIAEMPRVPKLSVPADQPFPEFVDFHNPPEAVPAQSVAGFAGSNAITFTLPSPPPFEGTTAGPS